MMQQISVNTLFIILIALIVLSAFFSSAETGMMALNRYRLRHLAKNQHRRAALVMKLLKTPDRLLSTILIGNTFANILASAVATMLAVKVWGEVGILLATVLLTFFVLIFAEIAPKTLAAFHPQRVAFFAAWPLFFIMKIFHPIILIATKIAKGLLWLFGVRHDQQRSDALSHEELRTLVRESGGRLSSEHLNMLLGVLELDQVTVEDIMVPRSEMIGIDLGDDWDAILYQLTHATHTRLPIYTDNTDNIEGILHLRAALNLLAQENLNKDTLLTIAEVPYFIPEMTSLNQQLKAFRENKRRLGLVVDEYGELQGMITLEDLLEEIVGEFTTDVSDTIADVHAQADGSYLVDCSITLRELKRTTGIALPQNGPKTLSGLIIEYLEEIPTAGTGLRLAGYPMEIVKVQDNMIKTARLYAIAQSTQQ
ncbi:MAG: transporter [marine bacterium B5-7]|nr:MAG: transporter [marine bacterium B5-7]